MQADVKLRAGEARAAVQSFGGRLATELTDLCSAHIRALTANLTGIRDGIVADEAATKRCKVPKCAVPRTRVTLLL